MGASLHRTLAEGSGTTGGRQRRAAYGGNSAGRCYKSLPRESVPALRLRHVDGAKLSPHPIRKIRDDIICHCRNAEEARALWGALEARVAACRLALHQQKTK